MSDPRTGDTVRQARCTRTGCRGGAKVSADCPPSMLTCVVCDAPLTFAAPSCDCDAPDTYYGPHREWCAKLQRTSDPLPWDAEDQALADGVSLESPAFRPDSADELAKRGYERVNGWPRPNEARPEDRYDRDAETFAITLGSRADGSVAQNLKALLRRVRAETLAEAQRPEPARADCPKCGDVQAFGPPRAGVACTRCYYEPGSPAWAEAIRNGTGAFGPRRESPEPHVLGYVVRYDVDQNCDPEGEEPTLYLAEREDHSRYLTSDGAKLFPTVQEARWARDRWGAEADRIPRVMKRVKRAPLQTSTGEED